VDEDKDGDEFGVLRDNDNTLADKELLPA